MEITRKQKESSTEEQSLLLWEKQLHNYRWKLQKSYLPRRFPCSFNIGNEITVKRALRSYIFQMTQSLSFFIFLPRHNAFSTVSNSINEEKDMQINSCYKIIMLFSKHMGWRQNMIKNKPFSEDSKDLICKVGHQ